jgi:DNA-binding beta-propeller fold protein YncE
MSGQTRTDPARGPDYRVLGQPTVADTLLASRCPGADARFGGSGTVADMFGPSGVAVDSNGRLYATDYGGQRALTWPDVDVLATCQAADGVIGAGELFGPEAVAVDPDSGTVFVADTLSHTVKGYRRNAAGAWARVVRLGAEGEAGQDYSRFQFPRGLAVGADGRLYVADDFNNRVLIFAPPFADGDSAVDSIGAGDNGGFAHPKAVAAVGSSLFVADYDKDRVLRFTGPFDTPDVVYAATGTFTGISKPVDLTVHPDGSLLVTDQGGQRIARYRDAAWAPSMTAPSASFSDHVSLEPLGVCADRSGRIYVADYRSYRILIRDETLATSPISASVSASAEALLADLHARPARSTHRVAIGQYLVAWLNPDRSKADPHGWYKDWLKLEQASLPLPIVMGAELSELVQNATVEPIELVLNPTAELIRHGRAGNMVTLVWHPSHPGGGDQRKPIGTADLRTMADPAAELGLSWQAELDRAAAVLQAFKMAGVPVLFRPLHEQNGNFFWWGHDGSKGVALRERQAAWAALWRGMVHRLTADKELDNLLFLFAANHVTWDGIAPPLTYYPGADWVDAVGIDVYSDELNLGGGSRGRRHYTALAGTGKPFGLAEFGQSFDGNAGTGPNATSWDARTLAQRVRDSYPRTVFAVAWYSSVQDGVSYVFALPDVAFTQELLSDPLIDAQ